MKYNNGFYVSIEKHDGVHDYEFFEGEVLYLSDFYTDEELGFESAIDGGLNFSINGVYASCTPEQFEKSFAPLDAKSVWFEFRDDIDSDCYDVLNAFTYEVVMTRSAEDVIQLSDIEYIEDEDLISGVVTYITEEDMFPEIREKYTRVVFPRFAVKVVE